MAVVNGAKISPLVYDELNPIELKDKPKICGNHYYFPKNQTVIWTMTASPSCKVEIEELNTIQLTTRLDISVADFYNDIGETTFIDRLAALLGIHPSRIKIVGVRQGSTILDYFIVSKAESENQTTNSASDNKDLASVVEKLNQLVSENKLDLGAPILEMSSNILVTADEGLNTNSTCVFTNYTTYTLEASTPSSNLL